MFQSLRFSPEGSGEFISQGIADNPGGTLHVV
jgi:hypothetical protein